MTTIDKRPKSSSDYGPFEIGPYCEEGVQNIGLFIKGKSTVFMDRDVLIHIRRECLPELAEEINTILSSEPFVRYLPYPPARDRE